MIWKSHSTRWPAKAASRCNVLFIQTKHQPRQLVSNLHLFTDDLLTSAVSPAAKFAFLGRWLRNQRYSRNLPSPKLIYFDILKALLKYHFTKERGNPLPFDLWRFCLTNQPTIAGMWPFSPFPTLLSPNSCPVLAKRRTSSNHWAPDDASKTNTTCPIWGACLLKPHMEPHNHKFQYRTVIFQTTWGTVSGIPCQIHVWYYHPLWHFIWSVC